jgi:hypothetical protein
MSPNAGGGGEYSCTHGAQINFADLTPYLLFNLRLSAVLRFHDILMWIQIRGSMPLTNGSGFGSGCGSGSSIFIIDIEDANKKLFYKKFFCILLFEGTFTSYFKDKKSKRSHKTVKIKVFLHPYLWLMHPDPDPVGPKTCGSGGSGSGSGSATLIVGYRNAAETSKVVYRDSVKPALENFSSNAQQASAITTFRNLFLFRFCRFRKS